MRSVKNKQHVYGAQTTDFREFIGFNRDKKISFSYIKEGMLMNRAGGEEKRMK